MLIEHKKSFAIGTGLCLTFLIVLGFMFTPNFGDDNAFNASDKLFNAISKGSTYYIPAMRQKAEPFKGEKADWAVEQSNEKMLTQMNTLLTAAGAELETSGTSLKINAPLGKLLEAAIADSDDMFNNNGAALEQRYNGLDPKAAMFTWWTIFTESEKSLKEIKRFKIAAVMAEIKAKAIEVGYNYYGIQAESAGSRMGILTFALTFYVLYTLWWGYGIFFLSDGLGLKMKGGKKKEV